MDVLRPSALCRPRDTPLNVAPARAADAACAQRLEHVELRGDRAALPVPVLRTPLPVSEDAAPATPPDQYDTEGRTILPYLDDSLARTSSDCDPPTGLQALFDTYTSDTVPTNAEACSSSSIPPATISLESFASFLVSADNPAFVDCVEKTPHEERHHHLHHTASPAKDEHGASGGGHDMTRVRAPADGRPPIGALPSPHELKGTILLKAKNLYVLREGDGCGGGKWNGDRGSWVVDERGVDGGGEVNGREGRSLSVPESQRGNPARTLPLPRAVSTSTATSESSPPSSYTPLAPRHASSSDSTKTPKMSAALLPLLVYTVGVKYRGINKKEVYAPQHMFSLSEHTRGHLVRMYPKGMRLRSSNYLPHSYWAAGAQLVAINWQTLDLGYMMNHAMFARNGGSGYVLKPRALRLASQKELLARWTEHVFEVGIISAQQLPPPKDPSAAGGTVDPYVEVSVHVPDWSGFLHPSASTSSPSGTSSSPPLNTIALPSPPTPTSASASVTYRTSAVKNSGFNPVWEERLRIPFAVVGDMMELVFVRFAVRQDGGGKGGWRDEEEPLAVYCVSLACLQQGYRHLPLHDTQLSQYMFSMLFVKIAVRDL
ncbi:PLC-like phosphodiesterase [Mycena rosella]|uniref:Phosphoinositide phospholipase C n=1 Tax=Mycena rosella TaxID=1033263 RepID=A0AAD7CSR1_MYCRO|nr:PLC-like phosphodiesterase [Mycena rosella]